MASERIAGKEMSHADRHDLDKLARWRSGLDDAVASGFPVFAAFLVTGEHREAHDVFRRYRSVFEELDAGFSSLVIFGQHGISTTTTAMLAELGMTLDHLPVLALVPNDGSRSAYSLPLPLGDQHGVADESYPWRDALERIASATKGEGPPALDRVDTASWQYLASGGLAAAIENALGSLAE